jgi:hypothetical protein
MIGEHKEDVDHLKGLVLQNIVLLGHATLPYLVDWSSVVVGRWACWFELASCSPPSCPSCCCLGFEGKDYGTIDQYLDILIDYLLMRVKASSLSPKSKDCVSHPQEGSHILLPMV